MKIDEIFDKYSSLYQFEEGEPEYLINKEDFKLAVLEYIKDVTEQNKQLKK